MFERMLIACLTSTIKKASISETATAVLWLLDSSTEDANIEFQILIREERQFPIYSNL